MGQQVRPCPSLLPSVCRQPACDLPPSPLKVSVWFGIEQPKYRVGAGVGRAKKNRWNQLPQGSPVARETPYGWWGSLPFFPGTNSRSVFPHRGTLVQCCGGLGGHPLPHHKSFPYTLPGGARRKSLDRSWLDWVTISAAGKTPTGRSCLPFRWRSMALVSRAWPRFEGYGLGEGILFAFCLYSKSALFASFPMVSAARAPFPHSLHPVPGSGTNPADVQLQFFPHLCCCFVHHWSPNRGTSTLCCIFFESFLFVFLSPPPRQ